MNLIFFILNVLFDHQFDYYKGNRQKKESNRSYHITESDCFFFSLFLWQYEINERRSSHGRCTASSTRSPNRRCRMTVCRRSRWRRAEWNDVPWSRGMVHGVPARGAARYVSHAARTRWTVSWTTKRACTRTRSHLASATWRIKMSARCRRVRSTMTESQSAGTASGTPATGSRKRWIWRCRRRPCGRRPPRTPPTTIRTLRPACRPVRARLLVLGTSIRPPVPPVISPTTGKRHRESWTRCSGKVRATPRSNRLARRAWTARTWKSFTAIGRPALDPATAIITVLGRRRRCLIAPTLSDKASDSSFSVDRLLIRILWSDSVATWRSLRYPSRWRRCRDNKLRAIKLALYNLPFIRYRQ